MSWLDRFRRGPGPLPPIITPPPSIIPPPGPILGPGQIAYPNCPNCGCSEDCGSCQACEYCTGRYPRYWIMDAHGFDGSSECRLLNGRKLLCMIGPCSLFGVAWEYVNQGIRIGLTIYPDFAGYQGRLGFSGLPLGFQYSTTGAFVCCSGQDFFPITSTPCEAIPPVIRLEPGPCVCGNPVTCCPNLPTLYPRVYLSFDFRLCSTCAGSHVVPMDYFPQYDLYLGSHPFTDTCPRWDFTLDPYTCLLNCRAVLPTCGEIDTMSPLNATCAPLRLFYGNAPVIRCPTDCGNTSCCGGGFLDNITITA